MIISEKKKIFLLFPTLFCDSRLSQMNLYWSDLTHMSNMLILGQLMFFTQQTYYLSFLIPALFYFYCRFSSTLIYLTGVTRRDSNSLGPQRVLALVSALNKQTFHSYNDHSSTASLILCYVDLNMVIGKLQKNKGRAQHWYILQRLYLCWIKLPTCMHRHFLHVLPSCSLYRTIMAAQSKPATDHLLSKLMGLYGFI